MGVPQGSIPAPLLFSINTNTLINSLQHLLNLIRRKYEYIFIDDDKRPETLPKNSKHFIEHHVVDRCK